MLIKEVGTMFEITFIKQRPGREQESIIIYSPSLKNWRDYTDQLCINWIESHCNKIEFVHLKDKEQ